MSHRKNLFVIIIICIAIFVFGVYSLSVSKLNFCSNYLKICENNVPFNVGEPLTIVTPFVVFIAFILLFLNKEIYKILKYFFLILIPLFVLIFSTPIYCNGIVCFDRETVSWFSGTGFLIISLLIIVYKKIQAHYFKTTK